MLSSLMTEEQLNALLVATEAKKDDRGFQQPGGERTLTLYLAHDGASLSVSKVEGVKLEQGLLHARTTRGELYLLALSDVYVAAVDTMTPAKKKTGFV